MKRATLRRMRENTLEEYLSFENHSSEKHEFIRGLIIAMTGGSPEHAALSAEVSGQLRQMVKPIGCRVFSPDLRIRVPDEKVTLYPDASVVCGKVITDDADRLAILNPCVIVEVTSPSTNAYDRTEKYEYYQAIPSLLEYIVVSHEVRLVEVFRRCADGTWELAAMASRGQLELESLPGNLDIDELYDGLEIPLPDNNGPAS
jgi:Uma2 family endonuclease